ncbi:MAG: tetratricopeptide repeat protein, partial [Planctomycetota bacterium]
EMRKGWTAQIQLQSGQPLHENEPPLSYQGFVARRAAEGYQLAFLLRAYSEIYEKGFPTEATIAELTAAINAKPGKYDYLAHYYLGYAYYRSWSLSGSGPQSIEKRRHFLEQSFEPLRKAISLAPKFSPPHHLLALGYKETERYPDALVAVTNLIALVPQCSEAYQIRGQIIADLGSRQGFEDNFKMALELRPNNAEALSNMGRGYSALKDWDAAIEAYKKALTAPNKQSDGLKGEIWGNLAVAYVRKDDCRNALAAFERFGALTGFQHPFEEYCRQRLGQ